jgi:plasmid stabilization system protein ParE
MKVLFKTTFVSRLEKQLDFIALDSPANARRFKNDVLKMIAKLPSNPLKCRKSIWFDDQNIRDLIFKGYTIVYRIDNGIIEVFGFVKHQNSPNE